ncbi:hypothetical protein RJT34_25134 [Clitoria ternatea]|uniref:Uncharacterized protein n=1 Tax=Clitoria ternatea TaxID=43366 RepID=A0AAN9II77_CLITE
MAAFSVTATTSPSSAYCHGIAKLGFSECWNSDTIPSIGGEVNQDAKEAMEDTVGVLGETDSHQDGSRTIPKVRDKSIETWSQFATRVSGEWDGFGADFSTEGKAIELPESVVPEAYREWEVKVFDWQTQCPTLAEPEEHVLKYKSIQLLPTVGCEADAATRYSVDERNVGGGNSGVTAFAYQSSGSYVAVWQKKDNLLELEHCLINPQDFESRVRIIQLIHVSNSREMVLQSIRVFREQWYGPFRNGEQLGGCAIRDSAFASTAPMSVSDVTGIWQGSKAVATFSTPNTIFGELLGDLVLNSVRDGDNILLPKQLWCSLKQGKDGETLSEAPVVKSRVSTFESRMPNTKIVLLVVFIELRRLGLMGCLASHR